MAGAGGTAKENAVAAVGEATGYNSAHPDHVLHHGVCYYPEHWPEERWALDARLMADAGFNTVRIGEFDWAVYEPREGRFEWDRLAQAVDVLHAAGLRVVLGTPTACPPAWLTAKYPGCLRASAGDGTPQLPQTRRHADCNDGDYRRLALRVVDAMAARFADHPGVLGYQVRLAR